MSKIITKSHVCFPSKIPDVYLTLSTTCVRGSSVRFLTGAKAVDARSHATRGWFGFGEYRYSNYYYYYYFLNSSALCYYILIVVLVVVVVLIGNKNCNNGTMKKKKIISCVCVLPGRTVWPNPSRGRRLRASQLIDSSKTAPFRLYRVDVIKIIIV